MVPGVELNGESEQLSSRGTVVITAVSTHENIPLHVFKDFPQVRGKGRLEEHESIVTLIWESGQDSESE